MVRADVWLVRCHNEGVEKVGEVIAKKASSC